MSTLTPLELERYSRQLPIIGEEGQLKLKNARVLVAGAGGLGSAVLYYLTAVGVGNIYFVDNGQVELSNLQRQILYTVDDLGRPKPEVAAERLRRLNPLANIVPIYATLDRELARELINNVDLVIDALDNWETRFMLDEVVWELGKPLVHAGVGEFYGQLTVIKKGITSCLRCIYGNVKTTRQGPVLVLPHVPGILGLLEVNEALKLILGYGEPLYNKILLVNLRNTSFEILEIKGAQCEGKC